MEALSLAASVLILVAALTLVHRPLGDYMARVYTSPSDTRIEHLIYRVAGIDSMARQSWMGYLRSLLAFSGAGLLLLYVLLRIQHFLPWSQGHGAVSQGLSFNTAISFVTNTNWQAYSGEQTLGYVAQAGGLAVQSFVSASVGMAVAVTLVRGLASRKSSDIGNFWVDLVRGSVRILLPMAFVGALVLVAGGVIQTFNASTTAHTIAGATQSIPGGPVASQEVIKLLGTNGGGFFNANSAHPFENPSPWVNFVEIFLMFVIPFSLPRTFGRMVLDLRQGRAVALTMATIAVVSCALLGWFELRGQGGTALVGAAMEGKEQRFGISGSVLFSTASTLTSTGAVNQSHDSLTSLGGMMTLLNMMIGEVAPGGVGSGLYGMLIVVIVAVFLGGLMVGRTPEYLGKKIGPREMKLASIYILVTPLLVLTGVGVSLGIPALGSTITSSIANPLPHGFTELLYAFTSAANNNGSAFGGLNANTPWLNASLGIAMLVGRFVPIVVVLALAGSFAAQDKVPETSGTLPTHRPLFALLTIGVVLIVAALTFFPVLALGPLAEGLM